LTWFFLLLAARKWYLETTVVASPLMRVCYWRGFLAFVIWKTLGQMCHGAGLGEDTGKVLDEIGQKQMVDAVLPTESGVNIRPRCVAQPTKHQSIMHQRLG
jgi:hypothetical protein